MGIEKKAEEKTSFGIWKEEFAVAAQVCAHTYLDPWLPYIGHVGLPWDITETAEKRVEQVEENRKEEWRNTWT